MGSSMQQRIGPDLANLNLNTAPPVPTAPTLTPSRENQYLQRIKELENDIRQARVENEKNVRISHRCSVRRINFTDFTYSKR